MASTMARVPFSDLAGFNQLSRDYCQDFSAVRDFYPRDWTDWSSIGSAVEAAAARERDRGMLVDVLLEQNRRWSAREGSLRNIQRLAQPESVAVVTGQQVGLFTGPLYTILKTITAIQLAQRIEQETGRPCVPVFWLEGEDHDFEEASAAHIPDREGLRTLKLEPPARPGAENTGPVGRIELGGQISDLIHGIEDALPPTEFRDGLLAVLKDTYREDATLRDAFAGLMRHLFPDHGLVFVSPDNTKLKRMLVPLFTKEIEGHSESFELLSTRSRQIESAGYTAQVHPHPMNLFMLEEEGRIRVEPDKDGEVFHLRGLDRSHSRSEMLDFLRENPCRFSPNVVMRPISQDTILPTAAYVAGPGEISYFAQLGPVYEWAGVPMPVIYPRASVTLIETSIRKAIDKLDVTLGELSGDPNVIVRERTLSEMDLDINRLFSDKSETIAAELHDVKQAAKSLDPTLGKSVESAIAGIQKQLDTVKGKMIRAAKRNNEQIGRMVEKTTGALFPTGKLQERVVSPLYFVGKHGPDLPQRLIDELSLDVSEHQVLDI